MEQPKTTLLEALKEIRDRRPELDNGICVCPELCAVSLDDELKLMCLFRAWPEYSGDMSYPVNSQTHDVTPREAYRDASGANRAWDETTPYGAARWRLLHWLIAQLETEQQEQPNYAR